MSQERGQGLGSRPWGAAQVSLTVGGANALQSVQFSPRFVPLLCPGLGTQR